MAFTPAEVADRLKVSTHKVYKLIEAGELTARRLGHRTIRITQNDLDTYLERVRTDAAS